MTIKQLSVFLENKTGRINDVAKTLAKYDINMHAFSMAESTDFGLCCDADRCGMYQLPECSRFVVGNPGMSGCRTNLY